MTQKYLALSITTSLNTSAKVASQQINNFETRTVIKNCTLFQREVPFNSQINMFEYIYMKTTFL